MHHQPNLTIYPTLSGGIRQLLLCGILLLAVAFPAASFGQEPVQDSVEAAAPTWPEDTLGRRTPRGTVNGFIEAVADQDYTKAAFYLDLNTPSGAVKDGAGTARALQRLLDQSSRLLPRAWISDDPSGYQKDDLGQNLDRVGTATVNGESFDILLEKTEGPDGGPIWLFSSQTIQKLPTATEEAPVTITDRLLPTVLQENKWGGVPIGHWLAMLAVAVTSYLIAWGITSAAAALVRFIWRKTREEPTYGIIKAFSLPIRLYLATWILVALSQRVGISIIVRQRLSELTIIIGLVAVLLLLWRLVDVIASFSQRRLTERRSMSGISIVLFLRRGAKVALLVLGSIAVLGTLGFDVTTGLAALGIGGIALALGAQKTVENFVGSVTLLADQPVRVGDFCKVGDTTGTVEQIGMRSTRLRTAERTIVTIPNGDFSSQKIENYAHRDRFLFNPSLRLRYDTAPTQAQAVLQSLRELLAAHPKLDKASNRVRLTAVGTDALQVDVFTYILTSDFNEHLEVKEELILGILEVVHTTGKGFALPAQRLFVTDEQAREGS
ncbi:mechanosensitive ion channel family protein [Pontibacter litorisediminis]|uniref:mechanosensitive ion channel family protein n=1 Tax=Pontibacter litorisediminis TaxID=1846260 RepID=UPI0023EC1B25|nr:mechanosensitive ion channel family protein [Pontibacter litorisediminis]